MCLMCSIELGGKEMKFGTKLFIFIIIIATPIILGSLIKLNIFSWSAGDVDSWIMFWGSYIGAIIGASAVYFVAQHQITKQYEQQMFLLKLESEQQLKAIELENIQSTRRELKKFNLTNKLEKIEEMLTILERLSSLNISLNNDLVTFSVIKYDLDKGFKDSNKSVEELEERIYSLRTDYTRHHFEIMRELMRVNVLSEYVPKSSNQVTNLQKCFTDLLGDVKECYYSDEKYIKYLIDPDSEDYAIEQSREIHEIIIDLSFFNLQTELRYVLDKIERSLY